MAARFLAPAREELLDHVDFYEARRPGLGKLFVRAVERAVRLAEAFPDAGRPIAESVRRIVVRDFPFELLYKTESHGILIIAIAHQSRQPGYWRDRI